MTTNSERNLSFDEILRRREAAFERDYGFEDEYRTSTFGPLKHAAWHKPDALYDMAVGDINSNAKGSGARANGDKVPMDLIPVSVWRNKWRVAMSQSVDSEQLLDIMYALEKWQEGEYKPLDAVLSFNCLEGACRVFAYGAGKYAAWNWAKGMAWRLSLTESSLMTRVGCPT
jgi:hypothetical protein